MINPKCVVFFETDALGPNVVAGINARNGRHQGKSNVVFADMRVEMTPIGAKLREMP